MEDGKVVGRIYEDRYRQAAYRWFWSITAFHGHPAFEITTIGRAPTLDEAKAQFKSSWSKVVEARKQKEQQQS
jgi:hypothetical protein